MLSAALAIAGLDPSGGAGLAADLRSFDAAGVWGAAVCAAITVQSTRGVRAVRPVASALVLAQAREVLADARVRAVKTGALGSAANVRAVTALAREHPRLPFVVDPVMRSTRRTGEGALLDDAGLAPLRALAREAALVTPNLGEAAMLLGAPVSEREARDAAVALVDAGARAALVKGGHGTGAEAVDWLALPGRVVRVARPRRPTPPLHGTGCALASLVAGRLAALGAARPEHIEEAVRWARARLDRALRQPLVVGRGLRVVSVTNRIPSPGRKAARQP